MQSIKSNRGEAVAFFLVPLLYFAIVGGVFFQTEASLRKHDIEVCQALPTAVERDVCLQELD